MTAVGEQSSREHGSAAGAATSVLVVTWNGGGNVNPILTLANRLAERGSEVTVLSEASLADRFGAAGHRFITREPERLWDPVATAHDVREACGSVEPNVVVVDYMMPTGICGAEATGTPVVVLVHTLFENLLLNGAPDPISMAASIEVVNQVRGELGLAPCATFGDLLAGVASVIVNCPADFDSAATPTSSAGALPANLTYVSPLLEELDPAVTWEPPPGDDPLVLVSLGTTPMDEQPVLEQTLAALAELKLRVVATVGSHLDPAEVSAPANCTVSGYVAHGLVMPHAAAVVTHAGLGTVLATLAHGLPMVCVPLGREQPNNAAGVARIGAGVVVAEANQSTIGTAVADAVNTVLHDPTYGRAAVAFAPHVSDPGAPYAHDVVMAAATS